MFFSPIQNEPLFDLIRVAQEDENIHQQLTSILSLESYHRRSALHSLIDQMKIKQAPDEIVLAISGLLEDDNAKKALILLNQK
ncbi:MAG: hypothetical protein JJ895_09705 [Balneolaceae bacterium]|nr:hypothetical protein [Balneolaceae bacterium]